VACALPTSNGGLRTGQVLQTERGKRHMRGIARRTTSSSMDVWRLVRVVGFLSWLKCWGCQSDSLTIDYVIKCHLLAFPIDQNLSSSSRNIRKVFPFPDHSVPRCSLIVSKGQISITQACALPCIHSTSVSYSPISRSVLKHLPHYRVALVLLPVFVRLLAYISLPHPKIIPFLSNLCLALPANLVVVL
jgi:hypothetical protein